MSGVEQTVIDLSHLIAVGIGVVVSQLITALRRAREPKVPDERVRVVPCLDPYGDLTDLILPVRSRSVSLQLLRQFHAIEVDSGARPEQVCILDDDFDLLCAELGSVVRSASRLDGVRLVVLKG